MRTISLICKRLITKEYFESKIDKTKYDKKTYCDPAFFTSYDKCFLAYDSRFIEKDTEEYKDYCLGLCALIGEDEENDIKKIEFPFVPFYAILDIDYHYPLEILKELLTPFIDEEDLYVITDLCDFVPVKEFVLNYNKLED